MACGKLGKFFLMGLNIIFFLLGLGIMVVGVLLKVNSSLVNTEIKPLLNGVTFKGYELGELMTHLSTFVICVGVFIFIISALGLIGVCCKSRIALMIYAIIVLILLIMAIAAISLFVIAKDEVEEVVEEQLLDLIKGYEDDTLEDVDDLTKGWNILFITMQCCGINAFETTNDFRNSTWWSSGKHGKSQIPVFCCKGVTQANYNDSKFHDAGCHEKPTPDEAYTSLGCHDAVVDEVAKYSDQVIGIGSAILVIQILSVIFAFSVCRGIDHQVV